MRGVYQGSSETVAGPSIARTARRFREEFGEDDLLLEYQNKLLGVEPQNEKAPP